MSTAKSVSKNKSSSILDSEEIAKLEECRKPCQPAESRFIKLKDKDSINAVFMLKHKDTGHRVLEGIDKVSGQPYKTERMNFARLLDGKEEKIFAVSKADGRLIFDAIEKHGTALTVTRYGIGTATRHIPTVWIRAHGDEEQQDDNDGPTEDDIKAYEAARRQRRLLTNFYFRIK
ncbi:MAG: hypothetical protein M3Y53_10930 [Thermoproteota archaeon]|nr:hypothetical protein [Thermoproteota archaeon]